MLLLQNNSYIQKLEFFRTFRNSLHGDKNFSVAQQIVRLSNKNCEPKVFSRIIQNYCTKNGANVCKACTVCKNLPMNPTGWKEEYQPIIKNPLQAAQESPLKFF